MWLGGQTKSFQNVGGGEGVYDVLTFQKSRGQELTEGGKAPLVIPLNESLFRVGGREYCPPLDPILPPLKILVD